MNSTIINHIIYLLHLCKLLLLYIITKLSSRWYSVNTLYLYSGVLGHQLASSSFLSVPRSNQAC
jgi:hypothetical protein